MGNTKETEQRIQALTEMYELGYLNDKGKHILESIVSYRKKFYLTLISHNGKDGLHVLATIVTIITGIMIMFKIQ